MMRLLVLFSFSITAHSLPEYNHYSVHHPLLPSASSKTLKKYGRARIWNYENENNDFKIGSKNPLLTSESDISFAKKNDSISCLPITLDDNDGDGNELQLALQIQSPLRQESQRHPHLPTDPTKYRKTGTTIVGCIAQNTVLLAADTRATEGSVVADKTCEKVHSLAKNVWACGAGTSGDLDALVNKVRYTFLLRGSIEESICNGELDKDVEGRNGGRETPFETEEEKCIGMSLPKVRISAICRFIQNELYKGGGEIGANLVLGGFDYSTRKAVLVAIHPHGSMDFVPFTALGSGGLAAMSVLESRYKIDMTVEEALELVTDAVHSGIKNDLGSGSQIDTCVISASGVKYNRGAVEEEALPLSKEDEDFGRELRQQHISRDDTDTVMEGVNGFGSLPYWIKSQRLLMESEESIEEARRQWLDDFLQG